MAFAELPFLDSFAHWSTGTFQGKYANVAGGQLFISTTGGRSGLNGAAINGGGVGANGTVTLLNNYSDIYAGMANWFQVQSGNNLFQLVYSLGGGRFPDIELFGNGDGTYTIRIRSVNGSVTNHSVTQVFGTAGRPLSTNTWYYFEVALQFPTTSKATASVYVNGNLEVSALTMDLTGVDSFSPAGVNQAVWTMPNNGFQQRICDYYVSQSSNYGDGVVVAIFPNGSGNYNQWNSGTPNAAHWQNVDETIPDSNTSYNICTSTGNKDSYMMQDIPAGVTVKALQSLIWAEKDAAGPASIQTLYRNSATDQTGNTWFPSENNYFYFREGNELSPFTGSSWTAGEINAMEFGQTRIT